MTLQAETPQAGIELLRLGKSVVIGEVIDQAKLAFQPVPEAEGVSTKAELATRIATLNADAESQLGSMGVPMAYREFGVKPFKIDAQPSWNAGLITPLLTEVWKSLRDGGGWVTLQGPAGIGKTHLGVRWLWRLRLLNPFREDLGAWRYVSARDWSAKFTGARGFEAQDLFRQVTRADVVLIDDAGQESAGRRSEAINDLIAVLYEKRRQVIITTNLTDEEIVLRYGGSITSRLNAKGNVRLKMDGEDLR